MKICYALLISSKYEQACRLINTLNVNGNQLVIFVDLKSEEIFQKLSKTYANLPSICFVTDRHVVNWGDVTQPKAVTKLLKETLKFDYDYCTLMSESCLPLYPDNEIKRFLSEHQGTEFFDVYLDWTKRSRLYLDHSKPYTPWQRKHRNLLSFRDVLVDTLFGWAVGKNKQFKSHIVPTTSLWWTISKDLTKYIVETVEKENYLEKYKNTLCSDEQMFGEVVYKSPFYNKLHLHNKRGGALHYIDWYTIDAPRLLRMKQYKKIYNTKLPYLYARKFDQNIDKEIVDRIYQNRENKDFKCPF